MKEFLSQNNIKFLYLDVTDSMFNLKKFLKYRDNEPEFEEVRKSGRVGLPCVMVNKGEKFIFQQSELDELIGK